MTRPLVKEITLFTLSPLGPSGARPILPYFTFKKLFSVLQHSVIFLKNNMGKNDCRQQMQRDKYQEIFRD